MQRPNILILYTDQQRWDALGVNGNAEIRTPHLDRLAAAGINFDHCFVQNPVCMPSRVSFLTGQYPSTLGLSHMGVPVPEDAPTLPRLLRNYGYCSGQIGKLHFLPHANRDHREPHPDYGFDHLEISDEPGSYHDAYRAWVAAQAPEQLDLVSLGEAPSSIEWKRIMNVRDGIAHPEERFVKRALASRCRSELTHTAFVAEQTMEFMTRHRDGPFLCVAGFYSPHDPWVAPQEFLDLYDPAALTLPPFPPAPRRPPRPTALFRRRVALRAPRLLRDGLRGRSPRRPHSRPARRARHCGQYHRRLHVRSRRVARRTSALRQGLPRARRGLARPPADALARRSKRRWALLLASSRR